MDTLEELTGGNLTEQAKERISKSYTSRIGERKIATMVLTLKTLNDNFNKGLITDEDLEKAFSQFDNVIEKSFHKYLRRTGSPGHYKYIYQEDPSSGGRYSSPTSTEDSLDAQADEIIQDSIDRYNERGLVFDPRSLLERSVKHGFITKEQSRDKDFVNAAIITAESWTEDQDPDDDFGSSDFTAALADFLSEAGVEHHHAGGQLRAGVEPIKSDLPSNQTLVKLTDHVKDWSGDAFTEAEVESVIEAAEDYGIEESMFRIETPRSQEHESELVNEHTDYITRNIPEGMWLDTMSRQDVRDIVWGIVMAKRGNPSLRIFDALNSSLNKAEDSFVFTEKEDAFLFNIYDISKGAPSGKIAKKVTVKKKDGGTYMATRYFSQEEIDDMEGKGKTQDDIDTDTSNKIYEILEGNKAKSAQLRKLIEMGIHHPDHLMALNGDYNESNVSHYLKEAGIDPKAFGFGKKRKAAKVNDDGTIEYETDAEEPDPNELEQEIEAMLRDGLLFDEEELMKPNENTGKDAVDTVQDKFTNMVAKGQAKLAMFYGTGGVGKTWGVKQIMTNPSVKDEFGNEFGNELVEYDSELQPNSDEYDFIKFTGQIAPSKLFRALYEHNGKIIMLDDCDSVLEDPTMVNLLKAATDTTLEDVVWDGNAVKPTGADKDTPPLPTRFKFKGGVIFISNLSEDKLRKEASPLLDSRALSLDITRTKEQTIDKLDRIKQFMEFEDTKGNLIEVSPEARDAAVEFVKKWSKYADIAKINARTFGSLAKDYESSRYGGVENFLKSHSARSIMNVLDHQVKKYIYTEKKKEMKAAKEKAALMTSIHNHL